MTIKCGCCGQNSEAAKHDFRGNPICSDQCYIALLENEVAKIGPPDGMLACESAVSSKTSKGFITIRWGTSIGQLGCESAVQMALGIITAANAADSDAAIIKLFTEKLEIDGEVIPQLLMDMRQYRALQG